MKNKVLLILVDGMRPDCISLADPSFEAFFKSGSYCFHGRTVFPSVTLPCHMSLFHSVDPGRHGTTSNTHMRQVHPINGLLEVLDTAKKTKGFVYTWEELRDLCTPGHLDYSWFLRHNGTDGIMEIERKATAAAHQMITDYAPDFLFLYLAGTDEWGHKFGWMCQEYINGVRHAWTCIQSICSALPEEYTVIVTADHGGHDRIHGETIPEDMTIPVVFKGVPFPSNFELNEYSILDIAPTIAQLLGVKPDADWEGTSVFSQIINSR